MEYVIAATLMALLLRAVARAHVRLNSRRASVARTGRE